MASRTIEILIAAKDQTAAAFSKIGRGFSHLTSLIGEFAAQLGLAFGAGSAGTLAGVKAMADEIARLGQVADRLGTTTEALSKLAFAAQRTGVDAAVLEDALNNLVVRVGEATEGAGEGYEAFQKLGLAAGDLIELAPEEQFLLLADALRRVGTQAERVQLVDQIFGDTEILQTLQLGRTEIERLGEELEELGGVVDKDAREAAKRFNEQLNIMNARLRAIGLAASQEVIPFLTFFTSWANSGSLAQAFADAEGNLTDLPPRLRELQIEMDALAGRIRSLQLGSLSIIPEDQRRELIAGLEQQLSIVREKWIAENKRITNELNAQTEQGVTVQETLQSRLTQYLEEQQESRVRSYQAYVSQLDSVLNQERALLEQIAEAGREQAEEPVQIGPTLEVGDLFLRLQDVLRDIAGGDADAATRKIEAITEAMNQLAEDGELGTISAQQLRDNLQDLAKQISEVRKEKIIDSAGQEGEVEKLGEAVAQIQQSTGENGEPLFTQVFDFEQLQAEAEKARAVIEGELDGVKVKIVADEQSIVTTREAVDKGLEGMEKEVEIQPGIVESVGEFGERSFSDRSLAQGHKIP